MTFIGDPTGGVIALSCQRRAAKEQQFAVKWAALSGCNAACPPAGGGGELLHQAGGQAEGGVPEGEGEGPHQAAGHGLRHLPE